MISVKSIQPNFKTGVTVRITVTVDSPTYVALYDGGNPIFLLTTDDILVTADSDIYTVDGTSEKFYVETSYTYDYTPTSGGGRLSLSISTPTTGSIAVTPKYRNWHNLYNNGNGVIKFMEGKDAWTSFVPFYPDAMVEMGSDLYSFKRGKLYSHNGEKAIFYGEKHDSIIAFRVFGADGVVKILKYITLESNIKPFYIHIKSNNPYYQATDLCPADLVSDDGTFFGSFLRDKLSPDFTNESQSVNYADALIRGDELTSKYFDIFLMFDNEEEFKLSAVNIGTEPSLGHSKK